MIIKIETLKGGTLTLNNKKNVKISIVAPVMNEEENIEIFVIRIRNVLERIPNIKYEIIFINDGSSDGSLLKILKCKETLKQIKLIDFSRNFGKEAAISAGLDFSDGNVVIIIDTDLQEPPELIPLLFNKWAEGFDIVVARRQNRIGDSYFKRKSAEWFYKVHNEISETKLVSNVGDYRLLDRKVVNALTAIKEKNRFMKGIFAWVGYDTAYVDYDRETRKHGKTKFSVWKLWNFGLLGITSFSTIPIRIWSYFGTILSLSSFFVGTKIILTKYYFGIEVDGYASIMVAITFIGGIQLIGIGVLGEYLGRTYLETKSRPIYIVKNKYD